MISSASSGSPTRRELLKQGSVALSGIATLPYIPGVLNKRWWLERDLGSNIPDLVVNDPEVKRLLASAIDAARSAGASFADGRITYTRSRGMFTLPPIENIHIGMSVRALVNGFWGWAAGPVLSQREAVRIAHSAVTLGKSLSTNGRYRPIQLAEAPVGKGQWVTPIGIDPFEVAIEEIIDWGKGLQQYIRTLGKSRNGDTKVNAFKPTLPIGLNFMKQERAYASTEGADIAQKTYETTSTVVYTYKGVGSTVPDLGSFGTGWEYIYHHPIRELVEQRMDEIDRTVSLPTMPLQIGRYDVVFHDAAMAEILNQTFANATQLDRARGYEANATGTSYLGPDPYNYLGTTVAAPSVTVTGNRSVPLGLATIGWDDEGVIPTETTYIKDGILVDYQTTREHAPELAEWYKKRGSALRSQGCLQSPSALEIPMQHSPNLMLHPGQGRETFESMIARMEKGLAVSSTRSVMDQQFNNAYTQCGEVFEIRKGKRVSRAPSGDVGRGIPEVTLLFKSSEFWKQIIALGGSESARLAGVGTSTKGDPMRQTSYSISAVPATVKQLALIDSLRKAS